jgi:hypothetical protein
MLGDKQALIANAADFVCGLEAVLGKRAMEALRSELQYTYFGTGDIVSIIRTRPHTFERAMKDIFGLAGIAIIELICSNQQLEALHP